jgi:hypothetical protein
MGKKIKSFAHFSGRTPRHTEAFGWHTPHPYRASSHSSFAENRCCGFCLNSFKRWWWQNYDSEHAFNKIYIIFIIRFSFAFLKCMWRNWVLTILFLFFYIIFILRVWERLLSLGAFYCLPIVGLVFVTNFYLWNWKRVWFCESKISSK